MSRYAPPVQYVRIVAAGYRSRLLPLTLSEVPASDDLDTGKVYFREMARISLLTQEGEIDLAKEIEELEAQASRPMRAVLLGDDPEGKERAKLAEIDGKIKGLRAKMP